MNVYDAHVLNHSKWTWKTRLNVFLLDFSYTKSYQLHGTWGLVLCNRERTMGFCFLSLLQQIYKCPNSESIFHYFLVAPCPISIGSYVVPRLTCSRSVLVRSTGISGIWCLIAESVRFTSLHHPQIKKAANLPKQTPDCPMGSEWFLPCAGIWLISITEHL